ncbi:MAG: hypothetical protein ABSA41_07050 [Terriglobia bacterium]
MTLKLTNVAELICVLSGVDEVKVIEAGVTLIGVLTVKGTTTCGACADRMTGVGRRGAVSFCAHANPAKSMVSPASTNIMNLRIPASFLAACYAALMVKVAVAV